MSDQDSLEYRSSRTEEPFQELNRKSANLKKILSRIPDEITDRKTFLETIKEIASAIKKLLDAVNEVSVYIPGAQGKHALEQRKREFVKYSKKFSNTLKEYFKVNHSTIASHPGSDFIFSSSGGSTHHSVHFCHVPDPPDQHGDDNCEG